MVNIEDLCFSCMSARGGGRFCQHCGFNNDEYTSPPHHLKPGTILAGKYILGKALGEGGFGITYVGYDVNLQLKVAVKEYFPSGFVTRDVSNTDTVTVFSGSEQNLFGEGKEKFINEARAMARFDNMPGIVSVKDFFLENGTAYIAMEFVEGETLKEYLNKNGGKAEPNRIFNMLRPLIASLGRIHSQGIIHRDISPDNIMITKNNEVKLLDFGAARDFNTGGQKSLSIQLKPGYAPEEQYRTHGEQGPWTDVYALCATIYRAITGVTPIESLERVCEDSLVPPSQTGAAIDEFRESILMRGLAVHKEQRIQNMTDLYNALYGGANTVSVPPKKNRTAMAAVIIVCTVIVVGMLGVLIAIGISSSQEGETATAKPERTAAAKSEVTAEPVQTAAPTQYTPTAAPVKRTSLYNPNYTYKRISDVYNSVQADDEMFIALGNFIKDYSRLCLNYINNGDYSALAYLETGSTAYEQQTSYKAKHPSLYEEYCDVEVLDCRYTGNKYYLWVTENMTVTENGERKSTTDHWVYEIKRYPDGYLISDYTRDPYYN